MFSKLSQECLVLIEDCIKSPTPLAKVPSETEIEVRVADCFKSPLPKPDLAKYKITKRRQSLRLQEKYTPCMKETIVKVKKPKKKPKNTYLDDIKKSKSIILGNGDASSDTTNNHQIISSQFPELSDSELLELVYQMTSFIENGVFDDANMDWNDSTSETDLTLLCPQSTVQLMPSNSHVTERCSEVFVSDSCGALDLSVNKNSSSGIWHPNQDQHNSIPQTFNDCCKQSCESSVSPSLNTQTTFDDQCYKNETRMSMSTQTESFNQTSSSTQTTFDNSCMDETMFKSISSQTTSVNQTSTSTQTNFDDQRSKYETVTSTTNNVMLPIESITTSENLESNNSQDKSKGRDRESKSLKRRSSKSETKPCQIFIQNYDMKNFAVNRKVFKFKIPKLKKQNMDDNGSQDLTVKDVPRKSLQTVSTQTNVETPQLLRLLSPRNNFHWMKKKVVNLLKRPCYKFLQNEDCGLYCTYNHMLPSATTLAESIQDWSNELVHFLYTTYIQRYLMCYLMYFPIICNIYVERRLPYSILATVKDCERFLIVDNLKLILLSLMRCGFGHDDALFTICTHANRTTSINKILEIITAFRVRNFKQTIAFLCTEIESYDFDFSFANEVLRQACDFGFEDEILLEFCYAIIRKCYASGTLNEEYMKMLLMKI